MSERRPVRWEDISSRLPEEGHRDGIPWDRQAIIPLPRTLTFEDIPDAGPCPHCQEPTQKEFLEQHSWIGDIRIEFESPIPGYGCINPDCGIKIEDNGMTRLTYTVEIDYFRNKGDITRAEWLQQELNRFGSLLPTPDVS